MLRPNRKEFLRLARKATLVPVAKSISADLQTPVSAFLSIAAGEPHSFLLESIEGGEIIGRHTFLGARPYCILAAQGKEVTIERRRGRRVLRERHTGAVLPMLRSLLREHTVANVEGLPPFIGGAVGFAGYDLVRQLERLPTLAKDEPVIIFLVCERSDHILVRDGPVSEHDAKVNRFATGLSALAPAFVSPLLSTQSSVLSTR